MKKIYLLVILVCGLLLSSCQSFLDRAPIAEIGSNDYFTNESSLQIYTNGFLNSYVPSYSTIALGDGYCDIVSSNESNTYLHTEVWTPDLQDDWDYSDWTPIYNINYFLQHFREVPGLDEATYNHYEATARFWRAWKYWDKVKEFGAVPWYDEPIDADDEENLYKARDNREYVMEKVLEDLNFACENLFTTADWVNCQRVSKYVALALKIRICLFEGTYRKYHSVDPSTGQAWQDVSASETYLRECVSACEELMNSGVYQLVDAGTDEARQTQYRKMFTSEDIDYTEIIWARQYSTSMSVFHQLTKYFTSGSASSNWALDQDFVQTYLHHDGSRHAEKIAERQAAGENVTLSTEYFADETQDRDYRLKQQIITPGYTKTVNGIADSLFSPVLTTAQTGYQIIKWNLDDTSYENTTNCPNSLPIFRYAETLLSYAEAKLELGEFSQSIWDMTIKPLRERSGVDGTRRTDIDQTLADYYQISDCDLVEIRRERAIEMLLEDRRYDDLMRWHLGELLNKTWYGIYIPEMGVPYDIDGNGSYDVYVVNSTADADPSVIATSTLYLSEGKYALEGGDTGRLVHLVNRYFTEQRYLHPIPKTALNINPDLGQNYYWQ
ncbi:MAG: RagB/SusD family nutrient uptake outer membrane protein [Bacteroidales bacterium]|nr:RagB/SusD family nutrient uptake outer membrane protein [Bacteroidales bacterium]